jgi:hypothetical protein
MFYWFEPVLYLDPVSKFPETTERPGYFVGFADNVGDALTFKILKMTWSKFYLDVWSDVNSLSVQNLFFSLYVAFLFQGHGNSQEQDLQLYVLECKDYDNVLMNIESQIDFDRLLQLHMLDKTEEDKDMSW